MSGSFLLSIISLHLCIFDPKQTTIGGNKACYVLEYIITGFSHVLTCTPILNREFYCETVISMRLFINIFSHSLSLSDIFIQFANPYYELILVAIKNNPFRGCPPFDKTAFS